METKYPIKNRCQKLSYDKILKNNEKPFVFNTKYLYNPYKEDSVAMQHKMANLPKYSTHVPQYLHKQLPKMAHNQLQRKQKPNDINTYKTTVKKDPYTKPSTIFLLPPTTGTYTMCEPQI